MLVTGDWDEAGELATVTRAEGSPLERQMAVMVLAKLHRARGNPETAWKLIGDILPRGPDSEPEDSLFPYAIETLRLATRLALDTGDPEHAREWLQTHDRWLDWSNAIRGRADSLVLWARIARLEGRLADAERIAWDAIARAEDPRQPLALCMAETELGSITREQGRLDDAEPHLLKAYSLSARCAAPFYRLQVCLELAHLRIQQGRTDDGAELVQNAREIADQLRADVYSEILDELSKVTASTTAALTDLTAREIEVLRMVAEGLTDAEVANALSISRRTVSQHLRSVYNKLGVSSRAAATRYAVQHDLV